MSEDTPIGALPEPDPAVEAELALHGVHTDAAPATQIIAETLGVPTADIAHSLGDAFAVIASMQREPGPHTP